MGGFFDNLIAIALPLGMLYFFCIVPLRRVRRARGWVETPCVILGSAVEEDQGDSGLFRVLVAYRYEIGGRSYRSSRYDFSTGATAGFRGKRRKVARLTPGTRTVCYVDPGDPGDSVLERGITWDMLLWGGFAVTCLVTVTFFIGHQ